MVESMAPRNMPNQAVHIIIRSLAKGIFCIMIVVLSFSFWPRDSAVRYASDIMPPSKGELSLGGAVASSAIMLAQLLLKCIANPRCSKLEEHEIVGRKVALQFLKEIAKWPWRAVYDLIVVNHCPYSSSRV